MENITRRQALRAGALGLASAGFLSLTTTEAHAASTIETIYKAPGPWAVATGTSGGHRLYHPAALGSGGVTHPIVTWGNGSWATPDNYPGLLNHLASWGFAVVASTDTTTGTGAEILAAAQHLAGLNGEPASAFHGKLNTAQVAAVGHSQGAGGSINAANDSAGLIKTVVPIATPAAWMASQGDEFSVADLTVPVLFLSGANDWLISSAATLQGYYDQAGAGAGKALLKGAGHNDVQNGGGGFLGYVTAWLRYRLMADTQARGAFAGTAPELPTNTAWQNQALKNLS
ncbi:alpha/beta hydrolase [Nonomuraea soli]|uniref:poly(ethylene terephthalate) hydrolase n=1 Tax=Nonomuraea soli TaxID=1032476 RepID=A0A7W0HTY1_9ACTN|nr:alpha/beta hydrolase [Nonomuraea soli]MBA2895432.1 pimeloyl-ACP methyl ester carboxylesterase [Nonomuraea soli]